MPRTLLPGALALLLSACAVAEPTTPLLGTVTPEMAAEITEQTGLVVAEQGTPECSRVYRASFRNAILEIRPGETMCWEIKAENDVPIDPAAIAPSEADPERTIVVKMWQDGPQQNTFLTFHNPFGRALKYRTEMMRPSTKDFVKTTSCPVGPKRFTIEQWPHPILAIRIASAVFVDDAAACD